MSRRFVIYGYFVDDDGPLESFPPGYWARRLSQFDERQETELAKRFDRVEAPYGFEVPPVP